MCLIKNMPNEKGLFINIFLNIHSMHFADEKKKKKKTKRIRLPLYEVLYKALIFRF